MSIEVMSWVWKKSTATGTDKFVLLAIADNAWDDGSNAWPSVNTISRKTGLSVRTVQRCIQNLHDLGELQTMDRPGHSNLYRVIMSEKESAKAVKPTAVVKVKNTTEKKVDEVWDALMSACGVNAATVNSQERGRHNRAVKALKESGATVDEIFARAERYRNKFPKVPMTPIALASHWSELDSSVAGVEPSAPVVPKGWDAIKQAREQRNAS
jgi:DNA-binding transcriptional regulator YhcF (GntR family)